MVFYFIKVIREREPDSETETAGGVRTLVRPVRIVVTLLLILGGALSLAGILNISEFLSKWFSFQGL
jgi:formate hydrogenlyase subunit 3/multisubunit Na+/H+ antiporter MnhD subunit